jgi:hypothetical protein
MQIVYLSNRPAVFAETWAHVRNFMPWIDEAIVVAPPSLHAQFNLNTLESDPSGHEGRVTLVDELALTSMSSEQLLALDHVRRNVTLRRALLRTDLVNDVFILSDDDYRPIKPIPESFFTEGGRDVGYYFHDLPSWPGFSTPFDEAQHVTNDVLGSLGAPRKAYGSHMPQIMRRAFWDEAFAVLDELRPDPMICEWALYFNIAQWRHPDAFHPPRPFQTMCWPPRLHEWQLRVRPPVYSFENFYPELYEDGNLFQGLPTGVDAADAPRNSVEKLVRWSEMGRRAGRVSFDPAVYNPWTKHSAARRVVFRLLSALRKAYGYVSIDEREAIAQIHGRLDEAQPARPSREHD